MVNSLIITALGVAMATYCTLALRSDRYIQRLLEGVLRSNRRPVTPDVVAQALPWLKIVLIIGMVMGVAVAVMGVVTLVIGVTTVLKAP